MKLPSKEEVYNKLIKLDPEKYKDLTEADIDIYPSGTVKAFGRFAPGYSANPKGKPKNKKVPTKTDITKDEIRKFGKDAKKALEHMLETASSRKEVKEISKILISYQSPKLANVESRNFESKTIEIKWVDDKMDLIDITPEEYSVQEEAAKHIGSSLDEALEEARLDTRKIGEEALEAVKQIKRGMGRPKGSKTKKYDNLPTAADFQKEWDEWEKKEKK